MATSTYTIVNSGRYIVITFAGTGAIKNIPKENLTIVYRNDNRGSAVYLNWPSGDHSNAEDALTLHYGLVSSPTVASDAALAALLRSYCDNEDINVDVTSISPDSLCLIGKSTGTNAGDFVVTHTSAETLTFSGYPSGVTGFDSIDIETIRQINSDGDVVATYSRDDVRMSIAGDVITVTGASFDTTDEYIVFTNIARSSIPALAEQDLEFTSNYTGKITGGNGDFDVSYDNATTIDIDTFPAGISAFVAADIGLIRQITNAGVWVADYTPSNSTITMVGSRITVAEAAFTNTDSFIIFTTVARSTAGGGSVSADFKIGSWDGSVTYASSTTLTLAGAHPTINYNSQLVYIRRVDSTNDTADLYVNGQNGVALEVAGGVLTINGVGTPFAATDDYEVGINATPVGNDLDLDLIKTGEQNPNYAHYTDPSGDLVTDADVGDQQGSWTDQGAEIPCASYNSMRVWVDYTANDSQDVRLRVLAKHESGGSEEYVMADQGEIVLGESNNTICYDIDLTHTIPYIQVQTKSGHEEQGGTTTTTTTPGFTHGTISIKYTLGYK